MGKEIYNIINDMAEVLNASQMLETIDIPVVKITTEMLRKYLVEYQTINNCGKETIPDEKVEILRDNCNNVRDGAMIDFLLSTGRVITMY